MPIFKAAFHTLGCKTNHYESDAIRAQFIRAGFTIVPFESAADAYLVITCTVTREADRKSRQMLRRARRTSPDAVVAAVGCLAELGRTTGLADIQVGTWGKGQVADLVIQELAKRGKTNGGQAIDRCRITDLSASDPDQYEEIGPVTCQSETRAFVKIEDGCNRFCTYCTIPLARGRVRSRSRLLILEEARYLAEAGFREIVLTGIHVCSYGTDNGLPSHAVMELALELAEIPAICRIRLGSLEPQSITPEFIELAGKNKKLLPHFHISLQSGSDTVLKRMDRHYRTAEYRQVVKNLRETFRVPGPLRTGTIGLTTDIMIGFPGETADEHMDSLAFCREIGFARMHVFRYSKRPGTVAACMPDQVDPEVVACRAREMLETADALALDFHKAQIGKRFSVLLENRQPNGCYAGYTPEYVPVRILPERGLETGMIAEVAAMAANRDFLICHGANDSKSCYDIFVKQR